MTNVELKYPWQFTAEEFLGPRMKANPIDNTKSAEVLSKTVAKLGMIDAEREEIEGFGVTYTQYGVVIYDGGEAVGVLGSNNVWAVDPKLQSTGIVSRINAVYANRYGVDPVMYLRRRLHTLTPEGEKLVRRVHALCVEDAVRRGLNVEERVLCSVETAKANYEVLRDGKDETLLALYSDKERKRKRAQTAGRYRWVKISDPVMQWLRRRCGGSLMLKTFEISVVPETERVETQRPRPFKAPIGE